MTWLGTAVVDITPRWPMPLAGFASRAGNFTAVEGRLKAKVFAFSSRPAGPAVILVCADLLWWGTAFVQMVRARIAPLLPYPAELILHASHTHSGPQTASGFLPSLGPVDPRYLEWLSAELGSAIQAAVASPEPVRIERFVGAADLGIDRRGIDPTTGRVAPGPTPDERRPTDRRVTVLRFVSRSAAPAALLVHYACHPVISNRLVVTGDFPAATTALIEEALAGHPPVGFLQGCAGDVNPDLVADGAFRFGGPDDLDRYGSRLAASVLRALRGRPEAIAPAPIAVRRSRIPLRLDPAPSEAELREHVHGDGLLAEWSEFLRQHPENMTESVDLELSLTTIGRGCALLAMNAEPVSHYARFVRRASDGDVIAMGYTDGMLGYLVTDRQLAEGGYEPHTSTRYFGRPAPFAAGVQASAEAALAELLSGPP